MGFFKDVLPKSVYNAAARIKDNWIGRPRLSYSSEGEDLILLKYFGKQKTGFYVDIGAAHPKRYSNTYALYKRGWQGLAIEPNPELTPLLRRLRKRDLVLQLGVSDQPGNLTYFSYEEPEYNTFSIETREHRKSKLGIEPVKILQIETLPLQKILDTYLKPGQAIDLMNVDTEGLDLRVLQTNDWNRFRPRVVLAEEVDSPGQDFWDLPIYRYLKDHNYVFFAKTYNTLFFSDIGR
jgi:FkbM family methyltransferase